MSARVFAGRPTYRALIPTPKCELSAPKQTQHICISPDSARWASHSQGLGQRLGQLADGYQDKVLARGSLHGARPTSLHQSRLYPVVQRHLVDGSMSSTRRDRYPECN